MEGNITKYNSKKYEMNERGAALIIAILISAVIFIMVMGVLYFTEQSTVMSGSVKRYATAEGAADGAIELVKDTINLTMLGEPVTSKLVANCTTNGVINQNAPCTGTITLPGTMGNYTATVTFERLYQKDLPGGRLEFARSAGVPSSAVFYRITTIVTGPDNTRAENSALYRYTG